MSERAHNTRYSKDQHSKGYEDQLDNNLNHLARMILENRNTVFVTGAGLSVASGIPTFRGSDNSVWSKNTVNSATTTSFHKDPLKWYNEFWIESFPHKYTTYQPNNGHESISWLANMFPNVNVITQNIDSLHQQTKQRWPHEQKLVEIHGRMGLYRCMAGTKNVPALQRGHFVVPKKPVVKEEPTCPNQEKNYLDASSFPSALQDVLLGHSSSLLTSVPECPHCAGPLAPLALLFNETYDSHCFYQFGKASKWVEESEAIVFVGTSFAVAITKYAVAQAQNRPLGCALFNINPFQELELRPNLRPKNMLKNAEDVLPRLVEIIKSKLGSHLSEEELEISSNGSSTPTKRSRTPASDSEMSVWESPSADELRKRFPLLHTFDHARYDLDPMLPEPLPQSSVRAALSFDNCRKNHPVRTVEAQINKIWRASQAENPKLFNGLKFRMSGYSFSPSGAFRHKRTQQHRERHSTLTLYLGLTDYKSFRGTNWSPQATQLLSDGVRDFGDAGAYMSQKLGVVSALMNQDGQLVCLRRSAWVGEGHGQLDGPGGHPEPENISILPEDLPSMDEERLQEFSEAALGEIFQSAIDEIVEETNIPRTRLSEPLLMGITRQNNSAGTPSAAFYVKCSATSSEITEWYEKQPSFESAGMLFLTLDELENLMITPVSDINCALTASFEGCIEMLLMHLDRQMLPLN